MKAIRWHARRDVRYEDVPEPVPGPGQVKARIHYSGICGTDLHEYAAGPILVQTKPHPVSGKMAPVILGHEFAGKVVELGEGVTKFKVGDRVTGDCFWTCGKCYYCVRNMPSLCLSLCATGYDVDGCFAECLVAPDYTFYKIPDGITDEIGALTEPLEVAFHAVRRGRFQVGETACVLGAGPIGCGIVLAARAAGASKIIVIEPSKLRREAALQMGATASIDPTKGDLRKNIREITGEPGPDFAFDCIGSRDSIDSAVSLVRKAGTAVIVGLFNENSSISSSELVLQEKNVVGVSAYAHEAGFILDMIARGTFNPEKLITGKISLKDTVEKGFEELLNNKEGHLKILLESPNWSL
jgi:(R,R)-butanediol dehydrogenase / meso-butanediol dehydrogenase / diacetyl reductase